MDKFEYVIVGGGLAGGRACQGIRKVDTEGTIVLVSGENHVPYQRPGLSKGYLTGKEDRDHLYVKNNQYYADNQIEILGGAWARAIDPQAHNVTLGDGRVLGYEKLLLATGGRAWRLPIPGAELGNVFTLRTIEDSDAIREAAQGGQRALVLGGSFIGSEVAASLAQLGAQVTMLFPESRLLERVVPEALSHHLHLKYDARGVRILTGTKPVRFEGNQHVERAVLDDGETLPVDLVVMGVGIRLNTDLARGAGLELGERDAVIVDQYLRTSAPDIYAAGDIAAWPDRTFDKRLRVEHWDVAWRQGFRAGRNMAGENKPYRTLSYFFSDLFDFSFEAWGDLTNWDQTILRGTLDSGSFAFFYFDQTKIVGVLAVNRPDQERKPMQALVKAGVLVDDIKAALVDESTDLGTLVE